MKRLLVLLALFSSYVFAEPPQALTKYLLQFPVQRGICETREEKRPCLRFVDAKNGVTYYVFFDEKVQNTSHIIAEKDNQTALVWSRDSI